MDDPILLSRDGPIASVVLNNPERRNALTRAAWARLGEVFADLDADDALRCVVVRGAGEEAFAAGADISEFAETRSDGAQARTYGRIVTATLAAIDGCRHPTIALIQGACTGGGLEIAGACDIRLCDAKARFGVPINRLGHVLFPPELADILRLVGPATAAEMLLEGRLYDAGEAVARGLVNRIAEDVVAEAYAAAGRIARGAPLAARMHKKLIRRLSTDPSSPTEAEIDACAALCDSADYREGWRAFLEKRAPDFKAR